MISSTHSSAPLRPPIRKSSSSDIDDATIIPSTDRGISAEAHCPSPVGKDEGMQVPVAHDGGNDRQEDDASGVRTPH